MNPSFKKNKFSRVLTHVLASYLSLAICVLWPAAAHADGRRVILIPIADETETKSLVSLKQQIESILTESNNVSLASVSSQGVAQVEVPGDVIYLEGERQFLNLEYENALQTCDNALAQLSKNPGIKNSMHKVWVLKAQIYLAQDKRDAAEELFEKAAEIGFFHQELDDFFYQAPIREAYARAYKKYAEKTETTNIVLQVKGQKKSPVYLNGALVGSGPEVRVAVPVRTVHLAAAGNVSSPTKIEIRKKPMTVTLEERVVTRVLSMNRIDDALAWGRSVNADTAVMMSLAKDHPNHKLSLRVVDVNAKRATPVTRLDVTLNPQSDSAASAAAHHILTVSQKQFSVTHVDGKRKTPKALLYGIIGVLVAGAGVGVALGMGGSGGSSDGSSVHVSGPQPE